MPNQYASLYDNIFIPDDYKLGTASAGVFAYPQIYHLNWSMVRKHVSDHVPVYLVLGARELVLRDRSSSQDRDKAIASAASDCIDLNHASAWQLERLVHVGPARAKAIIRERPWHSVDELVWVRGLGKASADDIAESGQVCPL